MRLICTLLIGGGILLILPGYAFAYIDPGTGSMIVQAVLAAVAAVSVAVGMFWRRLKAFLGRHFGRGTKRGK